MKNVLIINICKEKLGFYEFVKPIGDILKFNDVKYFTKHHNEVNKKDLDKASHVIICGTSLFDNEFIEYINNFNWIINFDKPVLGICGGMQIIGLIYSGKLKKFTEIGYYKENFSKNFLGLVGEKEVYHIHNNYVDFYGLKEFEVFSENKISQAIKHRNKEIYGVLFHPEVRQKEMIRNFVKL